MPMAGKRAYSHGIAPRLPLGWRTALVNSSTKTARSVETKVGKTRYYGTPAVDEAAMQETRTRKVRCGSRMLADT